MSPGRGTASSGRFRVVPFLPVLLLLRPVPLLARQISTWRPLLWNQSTFTVTGTITKRLFDDRFPQVLLVALTNVHDALALPYAGGNHNQWSRPGAIGGYQQQQQQQQQRGYNNGGGYGGYNNNNFGQGGRPQWQQSGGYNGQGAEAYHTHVFNEPDRYGYDYTIPGATVHYLMYKKRE